MSKQYKPKVKDIIHFDASICNGVCGIGVWDLKRQVKVYKSYAIDKQCSYTGEIMALLTAMEYAWENKISNPILLTDNSTLAEQGIPKRFTKKFGTARLHWIPRELNEEADALSKEGRLVSTIPLTSITQKISKNNVQQLSMKIRNYPKDRKVILLKRLASTEYQMALISVYDFKSKTITSTFNPELDTSFVKFFNSIRKCNETHTEVKSIMVKTHGIQITMKDVEVDKFIRESNLI